MTDLLKALIIAHEREDLYGDVLKLIKGVMFLGTPHRGSDYGYWARILGRIANIPLPTAIRTDLLKDLQPKSDALGEICTQFVRRAVPLDIITVYEREKIRGLPDLVRALHVYISRLTDNRRSSTRTLLF